MNAEDAALADALAASKQLYDEEEEALRAALAASLLDVTDAAASEMPVAETEGAAAAMGDALGCSVSPDGLQRALLVKSTAAPDEAREEAAAAATDAPSGGNMVIDDDCIVV